MCLVYYIANKDISSSYDNQMIELDSGKAETKETKTETLYYVNSAQCKIPSVDPFSKDAMDVYKPMVFETCTNDSDLITPIFDFNRKRYVLRIDVDVAAKLLNSSETEFNCYYQEITRYAEHDSYNE